MKKIFILLVLLLSMVGLTYAQQKEIISRVYLNGFTAPAWGEHPDFDLEVPDDANYTIFSVSWFCVTPTRTTVELTPDDVFNRADGYYYMSFNLDANDGSSFIEIFDGIYVYVNGDPNIAENASVYNVELYNYRRCNGHTKNFYVTEPGPNPDPNGYNFDDASLQGWTTIDADGDGHNWSPRYDNLNYPGHNGSTGYVISKSWHEEMALTPDNYLVTPEKKQYKQVKFWACVGDEDYPTEHFGVAVSTASGTNPADFTTIQEWTTTAKQGSWREYTADLSAYAGHEIWVAIRHFNSTDQSWLMVDDITLLQQTSVDENGTAPMQIYPNPAKETLHIEGLEANTEVQIYSSLGALVKTVVVGAEQVINVSDLPVGLYFVRCGRQTLGFVKE